MKQLVIFDGISGSGKSTTLEAINHARNFTDYHFHRFTATEWVYANLYNRPFDINEIHRIEKEIQKIFLVTYVWMSCNPNTAYERKVALNDQYIEPLADAQALFADYFYNVSLFDHKLIVSSELPLKANAEFIIEELEKRFYDSHER